jgi:thiol:disulfide interchange protein
MSRLLEDEERELEEKTRQRESEILAEIDGAKSESILPVVLTGLAIAVVLSLPALGFLAWKGGKGRALAFTNQNVKAAQPNTNNPATPIVWYYTLQEGLNAAAITGKPMMIDFYATWCGPCKMMDAQTYTHPSIMSEAHNFINVKVNAEYYRDDAQRFNITGYPTMVWTDSAGNERGRVKGGYTAEQFLPIMQQYR